MAVFWNYLRGPQIYTILIDGGAPYLDNVCESVGNHMGSLTGGLKNLCAAVSPVLVPYLVFRCQPSSLLWAFKCIVIFHVTGLFFKTFGRVTNVEYQKFIALLQSAVSEPSLDKRNQLKLYDYQSFAAPVDFVAKKRASKYFVPNNEEKETREINEPFQTIREVVSYICAHTFGRRMLYPGATALLRTLLKPALIDNRKKFISTQGAQRNVLQTEDDNKIDSIFFDRRGKEANGETLVIAFEGNAGFYEAGIMVTPLGLNYSVLGFNVPGFGESTGNPYPEGILNSVEAIMQFAIEKLGFEEKNIVLYAWSIGGFPASWAAANYPNVRALMLDASFDDLVPLAVVKMPTIMRSIVHYTIRKYFDLSIAKYVSHYTGPVLFIRRWNDEIIITDDMADSNGRRASNRANELLIFFLRTRYPGLLQTKADEDHVRDWLKLDAETRVISFDTSEPKIPKNLSEVSVERRLVFIEQLCNKHFVDFEASHNVPLSPLFFNVPSVVKDFEDSSF